MSPFSGHLDYNCTPRDTEDMTEIFKSVSCEIQQIQWWGYFHQRHNNANSFLKTSETLSSWYSSESSCRVLSDEDPFAMASVIFRLFAYFFFDQISHQMGKGEIWLIYGIKCRHCPRHRHVFQSIILQNAHQCCNQPHIHVHNTPSPPPTLVLTANRS